MNIKHPELIFMLLFIPLFAGFFYYVWKRRKTALKKLCDLSQLTRLFPNSSKRKVMIRYFLLTLAFSLFVISFISPRWGYDWVEIETKGANMYIALDVSSSMLAEDIKPNRLSRAKQELSKLLDKLTGDQVGLIIFAGKSFLQSPLTHDYAMIKDWLQSIQADSIPVKGTSIKSAIEKAMEGFSYVKTQSKAIILISDGEEHDKDTINLAKKAKQAGINIYSIGVGTQSGAPIPSGRGLIKDAKGEIVISKLDEKLLREIAKVSDGYFVRSTTGDFHLDSLYYEHIKKELSEETLKSGKSKLWYETYQLFAGIALILLLIELLLGFDWLARKKKALTLILLFLLANNPASANLLDLNLIRGDRSIKQEKYKEAKDNYLKVQVKDPKNPRLNYNLGVSNYRLGDFDQAKHTFEKSAELSQSPRLKAVAFYNLGNTLFYNKDCKSAIKAFEKSLEIYPDDENAKFNLAYVKKLDQSGDDKCNPNKKKKQNKNQDQDKDKDKDQDKKDQPQKKEQQKQDPDDKPGENDEPKTDLSKEQLEGLMRQIKEADSNKVNSKRRNAEAGKGGGEPPPIKPW